MPASPNGTGPAAAGTDTPFGCAQGHAHTAACLRQKAHEAAQALEHQRHALAWLEMYGSPVLVRQAQHIVRVLEGHLAALDGLQQLEAQP